MITKEQAEQAFYTYWTHLYEVRNLELVQAKADEVPDDDGTHLGVFDLEDEVWKCTFERCRKERDFLAGWIKDTCYVVEPKQGPYVVNGR